METDQALFEGEGGEQYQVYRDMREVCLRATAIASQSCHNADPEIKDTDTIGPDLTPDWSLFIPQTNVLWLRFLLSYLLKAYKKHTARASILPPPQDTEDREEYELRIWELEELRKALDCVLGKGEEGERELWCAGDVVLWCMERGWLAEGDRV